MDENFCHYIVTFTQETEALAYDVNLNNKSKLLSSFSKVKTNNVLSTYVHYLFDSRNSALRQIDFNYAKS